MNSKKKRKGKERKGKKKEKKEKRKRKEKKNKGKKEKQSETRRNEAKKKPKTKQQKHAHLLALMAEIVGEFMESETEGILVKSPAFVHNFVVLFQVFKLEAKKRFFL